MVAIQQNAQRYSSRTNLTVVAGSKITDERVPVSVVKSLRNVLVVGSLILMLLSAYSVGVSVGAGASGVSSHSAQVAAQINGDSVTP